MKKQKPKYKVIRELTESEIKAIIGNNWIAKRWWLFAIIAVLILVAGLITARFVDNDDIGAVVFGVTIFAAYMFFAVQYIRAGKKYWKQVKDTEQPFEIK